MSETKKIRRTKTERRTRIAGLVIESQCDSYEGEIVPQTFVTGARLSNRKPLEVEKEVLFLRRQLQKQMRVVSLLTQENRKLKARLSIYERRSETANSINEIKQEYYKEMVQSSEFGRRLDCTRQNINRLRREHKLLAVSGKNGNYYPLWQLDSENSLYPCMPYVIEALGFDNQWTIVQFFHTVFECLGGITPIAFLQSNPSDDVEVPKLAQQYFEQTCD